jgi:hypothetical protein
MEAGHVAQESQEQDTQEARFIIFPALIARQRSGNSDR